MWVVIVASWLVVGVLADGSLELLDALGHAHDLLLNGSLFGLEVAHLLLQAGALGAHLPVVARDLLINSMQLILEGFSSILAFHGKHILESFFLRAQNLHLLLVGVQLLVKGAAKVHQAVELALEVSSVVGAGLGRPVVLA